jgi:hypothetical protein
MLERTPIPAVPTSSKVDDNVCFADRDVFQIELVLSGATRVVTSREGCSRGIAKLPDDFALVQVDCNAGQELRLQMHVIHFDEVLAKLGYHITFGPSRLAQASMETEAFVLRASGIVLLGLCAMVWLWRVGDGQGGAGADASEGE